MSNTVTGFVEKLNTKHSPPGSPRPWTAYSMKIMAEDGTVDDRWFGLGFEEPPCAEGDFIQFEWAEKDGRNNVVKGSVQVSRKQREKPTSDYQAKKGSGGGGSSYSGPKSKTSELFGEIGGYNTEDDIRRMSWGNCRDAAVRMVGILVANNALPMSIADSKAGMAKRFEEINAYVNKKTVEFYFDAATGRVIDQVGDAGIVEESLPEPVPGQDDFEVRHRAPDDFDDDDEFE